MENFNKKEAEAKIKKIKNEDINPYRDVMKDNRDNVLTQMATGEKAYKGYKEAISIEENAKNAGINLDKDAMRRLNKIKSRFQEAAQQDKNTQFLSNQVHKENVRKANDFVSGQTAAQRKQRSKDYTRGL